MNGLMMWLSMMVGAWLQVTADDLDRKPIEYGAGQGSNAISRLQKELEAGTRQLTWDPKLGYLPALLQELGVVPETQTLVFSKTSFQRNKIAPESPRALYFNDEVYIGYCLGGELLEISVADSRYGTEFYSLSRERDRPKIRRQTEECLICHASSATRQTPGHLLRSVYPDRAGLPLLAMGSHRQDPTLPWEKRLGGWYVSHSPKELLHLGNLAFDGELNPDRVAEVREASQIDFLVLAERDDYLRTSSELLAHALLAHQVHVHNALARLSLDTQIALYQERMLNQELGDPVEQRRDSTTRRIRGLTGELVKALLWVQEVAPPAMDLESPLAKAFSSQGPHDQRGRGLRQLAGEGRRLFRYPCSYLIYSSAVLEMPEEAKRELVGQLQGVLLAPTPETEGYLTPLERQSLIEILSETWPLWPK